jgi:hypothetical protein
MKIKLSVAVALHPVADWVPKRNKHFWRRGGGISSFSACEMAQHLDAKSLTLWRILCAAEVTRWLRMQM